MPTQITADLPGSLTRLKTSLALAQGELEVIGSRDVNWYRHDEIDVPGPYWRRGSHKAEIVEITRVDILNMIDMKSIDLYQKVAPPID